MNRTEERYGFGDCGGWYVSNITESKFRNGQRVKCFYGEGRIVASYFDPFSVKWTYTVALDMNVADRSKGSVYRYSGIGDSDLKAVK